MKIIIIALFLMFDYIGYCYSSDIIINGRAEIIVTKDMNQILAEYYAEEQARNMAIESGGTLLESNSTIVNNLVLKDDIKRVLSVTVNKVANSEVKNYVVLSEKEELRKLYYSADYIVKENEFTKNLKALQENDKLLNTKLKNETTRISNKKKEYDSYNQQIQKKLKQYGENAQANVNWEIKNIDMVSRMYRYHELCKQYYDNDDYLYALIFADKVVELGLQCIDYLPPTRIVDNYLDASNCAFEFGDYDKADSYAEAVRQTNNPMYFEIKGKLLFQRKQIPEARERFKKSFALNNCALCGLSIVDCNFIMCDIQENKQILNEIHRKNNFDNNTQRNWYVNSYLFNQFFEKYVVDRIPNPYEVTYKRRGRASDFYRSDYYDQYLWKTIKGEFLANFHYTNSTRSLRAIKITSVDEQKYIEIEIFSKDDSVFGDCYDSVNFFAESVMIGKDSIK